MNHQDITSDAKRNKINFIANILLFGFIVSACYYYVQGVYLGQGYPNNTFLFIPSDRFMDFVHTYNLTVNLNPYFGNYLFNSNYFPLLHIMFYPFTLMSLHSAFLIYIWLFAEFLIWINYRYLKTGNLFETIKNVLIISVCSYPILIVIDRGSFEGYIFALLAGFFIAYDKNKETLACVFLAAAISTKIYPAVFIVLLVTDRKYRAAIITCIFVICFTLMSLILFKGGFVENLEFISGGFNGLNNHIATSNTIQRGVSLFAAMKMVIIKLGWQNTIDINYFLRSYMISVLSIFLVLSCAMWYLSFKAWEKAFLLVSTMLLFPHISCDYKLIHMYLPMYFLVNENPSYKSDYLYLAAIGVILIPKNYFLLQGVISDSGYSDLGLGIFVNVILLVAMSLSILVGALKRNLTSGTKPVIP